MSHDLPETAARSVGGAPSTPSSCVPSSPRHDDGEEARAPTARRRSGGRAPSSGSATAGNASGLRVRRLDLAPILTVADVARLLGLQSVRAGRRLIAREGMPHVRIGKRVVVLLESLLPWLKAREMTGVRADRVRAVADRLRTRGSRVDDVVRRLTRT